MSVIRQTFLLTAVISFCFSINMTGIQAGTNDVEVILGDTAGVSEFQVQNSATVTVFHVDSLGSMTASVITVTGTVTAAGTITAGNFFTAGTVTANSFLGDGTNLTGIIVDGASITLTQVVIANGTITTTNLNVTGSATVTGTVTAGNFSTTGDITAGSSGQFTVNSSGSATAAALVVSGGNFTVDSTGSMTAVVIDMNGFDVDSTGTITAISLVLSGTLTTGGGAFIVDENGLLTTTGTITAGNFSTAGTVTANSFLIALPGTVSVSMGTSTDRLQINGNLHIEGNLSKLTGTFEIPHPDPKKFDEGYRLRHSFVESPTRGDNLYRYEVVIKLDEGETFVELPSYWKFLNENPQVWVSAVGQFARGYGYVDETLSRLIIKGEKKGAYNVLLVGTRKDKFAKKYFDPLGVEYKANSGP
ncbi:MAG: hypothetical protein ACUZ8O_06000 [Candidatus Anammoxibacter sp.]